MSKKQEIKNRIDLINKGEVPEGYKNSWGYIYPEEWGLGTLNSLCSKVQKKNKENAQLQVLTNSATKGVILQEEYFDREIVNNENTDGYYIVEAGDFMYNPRISATAPAGPINRNNLGISGIASPLYSIFRAKKTTNTNFIEKYFESSFWHGYMKRVSNQGARHDRLNLLNEDFYKMPIPQPNANEQEKIAEILNCCDKVIELKENLLDEKNNEKKCLINRLLEKDLNNNKKFKKYKLSDFGDFYRGHSYSEFDVTTDITQLAVLRSNNIQKNTLVFDELQYVTKKCNNELLLRDGDIIICMSNGSKNLVGKVAKYYGNYNYPITAGAFCAIYRSQNKISLYLFQTKQYRKALHIALAGTNINNIKSSDIEDIEFWLPINEIDIYNIYNILNKKDKEIDLLEQELEQYKQLKKSLSQLLLTGIVRVNEV